MYRSLCIFYLYLLSLLSWLFCSFSFALFNRLVEHISCFISIASLLFFNHIPFKILFLRQYNFFSQRNHPFFFIWIPILQWKIPQRLPKNLSKFLNALSPERIMILSCSLSNRRTGI